MTASLSKQVPRLQLLDALRFFAAVSVVAYHWLFRGIETGAITSVSYSTVSQTASYGYLGVHLFFLISGFVIAASAHGKSASNFAVSRLVRIYPAFWVAVLFTALITFVWGAPTFKVTYPQLIANLSMVPNVFDQPLVDESYWTLFHELVFYVLVFTFLFLGLAKKLDTFFPAWALVMVAISVIAPQYSTVPMLGTLYSFFAGGAIISTIQRRGWTLWTAVGLLASLYVAVDYTITDVARLNGQTPTFVQSTPVTVAIICLFFCLLLVQTLPGVATWAIRGSATGGAITYPLYLLHAHFGFIVVDRVATEDNKWLVYAVLLVGTLTLAYLLNRFVEVAPKKFWRSFFDKSVGWLLRNIERPNADRIRRGETRGR